MFEQTIPYIVTAVISGVTGVISWFAADKRRAAIAAKTATSEAKRTEADAISVEIENAKKITDMYVSLLDRYKLEFQEIKAEVTILRAELSGYRNEVQVLRKHVSVIESENETLRKEINKNKTAISKVVH